MSIDKSTPGEESENQKASDSSPELSELELFHGIYTIVSEIIEIHPDAYVSADMCIATLDEEARWSVEVYREQNDEALLAVVRMPDADINGMPVQESYHLTALGDGTIRRVKFRMGPEEDELIEDILDISHKQKEELHRFLETMKTRLVAGDIQ